MSAASVHFYGGIIKLEAHFYEAMWAPGPLSVLAVGRGISFHSLS